MWELYEEQAAFRSAVACVRRNPGNGIITHVTPCRLRLSSGFSASCLYAVESEAGGRLSLPSSLYLPRRERDSAALIFENGLEREVSVTFEPTWGAATFVFVDRPQRA